jgi:hypothetical protein
MNTVRQDTEFLKFLLHRVTRRSCCMVSACSLNTCSVLSILVMRLIKVTVLWDVNTMQSGR